MNWSTYLVFITGVILIYNITICYIYFKPEIRNYFFKPKESSNKSKTAISKKETINRKLIGETIEIKNVDFSKIKKTENISQTLPTNGIKAKDIENSLKSLHNPDNNGASKSEKNISTIKNIMGGKNPKLKNKASNMEKEIPIYPMPGFVEV